LDALQQIYTEIAERLTRQGRVDHPVNILVDDWKAKCEENGIPRQRFHDAKNTLTERQQIRLEGPHVFLVRPVLRPIGGTDRTDSPGRMDSGQTGQEPDTNRTGTGQPAETPEYLEF